MKSNLIFFVFLVLLQGFRSLEIISARKENELTASAPTNHAKLARCIVHKVDWTAMGTLSTDKGIKGYPMVNVIAMADSAIGEPSTGEIYYLLTDLDFTGQDLKVQNKLTAFFTMEQYTSCTDPMEPTCARIMISGQMKVLTNGVDKDYAFGNRSMYIRHPNAVEWNATHSFYLCKLDIVQVVVLDFYGGPHYIEREDYFREIPDDNDC